MNEAINVQHLISRHLRTHLPDFFCASFYVPVVKQLEAVIAQAKSPQRESCPRSISWVSLCIWFVFFFTDIYLEEDSVLPIDVLVLILFQI